MFLQKRQHKIFAFFLAFLIFLPHIEVKGLSFLSPLSRSALSSLQFKNRVVVDYVQRCEGWLDVGELDLFLNRGLKRVPPLPVEGEKELLGYLLGLFLNQHFDRPDLNGELLKAVIHLAENLSEERLDLKLVRRDGSLLVLRDVPTQSLFSLLAEDFVEQAEKKELDEFDALIFLRCFLIYERGDRYEWHVYDLNLLERVVEHMLSTPSSFQSQNFYSMTAILKTVPLKGEGDLRRVGEILERMHRHLRNQNYYDSPELKEKYLSLWDYLKPRMVDRLVALIKPKERELEEKEDLSFEDRPKVDLSHLYTREEVKEPNRVYFDLVSYEGELPIKLHTEREFPKKRGKLGGYTVERVSGGSEEFLIWETARPEREKRCRRVGNFLVYRPRPDSDIKGGTLYSAHDMTKKGAKLRHGIVELDDYWVVKDSVQVEKKKQYFRAWSEELESECVVQTKKRKSFGKNYFLIEELGAGGFAKVYLAWDKRRKRAVAIKRMLDKPRENDYEEATFQKAKRNFEREYRLQSRISSEHILQVRPHSRKRVGDYLAFVMEEVGVSLKQKLRESSFSFEEGLEVAIQATQGVRDLHDYAEEGVPQRLLHGDVTPPNLILTSEGKVKLIDFGLARSERGNPKGCIGNLSHSSPENLFRRRIDQREDVYGLGATLFGLLSGRPLFFPPAPNRVIFEERIKRLKKDAKTHVAQLRREFAEKLFDDSEGYKGVRDIIRRAMAYYPEDRYQTVAEMQRDLLQLQKDPTSRFPMPLPRLEAIQNEVKLKGTKYVLERLAWWEEKNRGRYKEQMSLYRFLVQMQSARKEGVNLKKWRKVFLQNYTFFLFSGEESQDPFIRLLTLFAFFVKDEERVDESTLSAVGRSLEGNRALKEIFDSFVRQKEVLEELLERRDRLLQEPVPKVIKGDFRPVDIAV